MLKPSLQLRLGQQLTMTPQLQQAIRLLQLPVLDLQAEIQAALESNVMLEQDEPEESEAAEPLAAEDDAPAATAEEMEVEYAEISTLGQSSGSTLPDDLRNNFDYPDRSRDNLQDHLLWQLQMDRFSDRERSVGEALIDAINEDGYLSASLAEIEDLLRADFDADEAEIERVLIRIQRFDPVGVGARDLSECLGCQLEQFADDTPGLELARAIAAEHLELVAQQQLAQLRRRLGADQELIDEALCLLRSLNPRPGGAVPSGTPEYIVPDVFVRRQEGRWVVEANPSIAPRLRVNQAYARLISRESEYEALRTQLQEARWLVKSLEIRNDTLLRVARTIVERQEDFLEQGEESMKPMILKDIAEAIEMHESTISRATTGKYMHTPRGVFEFRFFFSSHVSSTDGGEISSTAIRARIRKLVGDEPPEKPLSDSKIASLLEREGIKVARRTVAKYRESLGIPSSSDRRKLAAI
ncbi:MAG: RNA polymerase factor sigma-54 [Gammaproteobacteria bacterium]|jgi:RNA polymerase sigma-54 factor